MKNSMVIVPFFWVMLWGTLLSYGQQAVSDEAHRHFDRGMAAVETAKSPEDYESAITEFKQAVQLAPAWPDAYYNLGMIQEKAEKYGDAIASLRNYLRLAPEASDAETVKSFINKMEYKKDKEEGVKKVYEMMTSDNYQRKRVGDCKKNNDGWLSAEAFGTLRYFRMESGEMQASGNGTYDPENFEYHPKLHPPTIKWNPVKVNGRFYEYVHSSYIDVSSGYVVRIVSEAKGEIISIDPPRVKEIVKSSVTWGAPIPGDQNSGGRPWSGSGNLEATAECVYELIAKGADINARDKDVHTPQEIAAITFGHTLHDAASLGQKELAGLLLAKGKDINARDTAGNTPLHMACMCGKKEMAELLIAKGAAINAKNNNGLTPLIIAYDSYNIEVAELLIAKGADVNTRYDNKGSTLLHHAVIWKPKEVIELLIANGADIKAKDNDGATPLHMACIFGGKNEIAELLIAKGADINARDNKGDTPLHYAERNNLKDMAELLKKHGAR
jgi:tetratricopeptide (TPR) repeat protein